METVVWLLNGNPVLINEPGYSSEYLPDAKHGLHVKKALDILSRRQLTFPTTVTIDEGLSWPSKAVDEGLGWPVQAIVEPNRDRVPQWAVHVRHRLLAVDNHDKLSPFVMIDRDQRLPMTKALTVELAGTPECPIMMNVYPGSAIPPLPWQLSPEDEADEYQWSLEFWRRHSFLYNKHHVGKSQSPPPSWFAAPSCHSLQPR